MGRAVFNILIIAVLAISVWVLVFVLPLAYKKSVEKGWKVIRVICLVLCAAMIALAVTSLDWNGKPIAKGELIEVHTRGSRYGMWDRYVIVLETDDGKQLSIESVSKADGLLIDGVEDLSIGSRYEVHGSTINRAFFYSIKPVSE